MVFVTRSQLGCVLLVLLSIWSLYPPVLGARKRYLVAVNGVDYLGRSREVASKDYEGVFAASEREVPSGSDPLHNR